MRSHEKAREDGRRRATTVNAAPRASQGEDDLAKMVEPFLPTAKSVAANTAPMPQRVALFGFDEHRRRYRPSLIRRNAVPVTIDAYNQVLGFQGESSFLPTYFQLIDALKNNKRPPLNERLLRVHALAYFPSGASEEEKDHAVELMREQTYSWIDHLRGGLDKLDMQARLKKILARKGLFSRLGGATRKNVDPFLQKNAHPTSMLLVKQRKMIEKFAFAPSAEAMFRDAQTAEQFDELRWLIGTVSTAFFRQTSKLGLDWFHTARSALDIDRIDFILNDFGNQQQELTTPAGQSVAARRANGVLRREPITYSEYRHALRKGIDINPLVLRINEYRGQ